MTRRLNLGCGTVVPDGWTNCDRNSEASASSLFDVADVVTGLPYNDGAFSYVVAHHTLQMISYVDLPAAFAEIRRVLVDDGTVRLSVPDPRAAFDAYLRDDPGWFPIVDEAERSIGGKLCAYLTWYSEARTVFTPGWLCELLVRNGFGTVAVAAYGVTILGPDDICQLDGRAHESIYVEGRP